MSETNLMERLSRRLLEKKRRLNIWYALNLGRKPVVKVYGLLRTGTNYLTQLIEMNFHAFSLYSLEEGWKHGPCNYNTRCHYVFVIKDPYSWLVSFMEWEIIHGRFSGREISEFLTTPITHPELRQVWGCDDVVAVWSSSLSTWKKYAKNTNVVFVRYEDVTTSFETELRRIGGLLGLKQRNVSLVNLRKRADNWNTPKPRKDRDKNYYRDAHYLEQFTKEDLDFIRERLDQDLVELFGYQVL